MRCFNGVGADDVWRELADSLINRPDHKTASRCGNTNEILQCCLTIDNPKLRWILSRKPPYNPAYGLVEFIWIFNGEDDGGVLRFWNPQLPAFTGQEKKLHGAYGYRLRKTFAVDQVERAYRALTENPNSRQIVLQIWNPIQDLPEKDGSPTSQDVPCNISSLLVIRDKRLYWTQIMRSNDLMLGLPYNIIQFTMLHEFFASWLNCELGEYVHISNSMHVYENSLKRHEAINSPKTLNVANKTLSINQTFEESSNLLSSIYEDLKIISMINSKNVNTGDLLHSIFSPLSDKNKNRPESIQNMLCVIGSDAARRHGYIDLANILISKCSEIHLRIAAKHWLDRNIQQGSMECLI